MGKIVGRRVHTSLSVRGAILSLAADHRKMAPGFSSNGKPLTRCEAIEGLMDYLASGTEVLKASAESCDGWDPKTGCPGHPFTDTGVKAHE